MKKHKEYCVIKQGVYYFHYNNGYTECESEAKVYVKSKAERIVLTFGSAMSLISVNVSDYNKMLLERIETLKNRMIKE